MVNVKIYAKETCPYCRAAKELLDSKGVEYEYIDVIENPEEREKVSQENGNYRTVPMIFIGDDFIGGYSDIQELEQSGELDEKLGN